MKKTIAIAALAFTGCASVQYVNESGEIAPQQVVMECDYEARKATAGIMNGFQAGWEQGTLRRQCLEVKGYRARRI